MAHFPNPYETLFDKLLVIERQLELLLESEKHSQNLMHMKDQTKQIDRTKAATKKIASEYLGVSLGTIDNLIKSKQLKPFYIGKAVRFKWSVLDEFITKKQKN